MFAFTDEERASLAEMRALALDSKGREILVGLNFKETEFCMEHRRQRWATNRSASVEAKKMYKELLAKHELARFAVLAAEKEKANNKPTLQ